MFSKKLILVLFIIPLPLYICDKLQSEEESEDCEDDVIVSDENSTMYYHTLASKSVKFYLLTPENEKIPLNETNLHLINTTQPIKFIIHGLGDYIDQVWVDKMATVYHTKGPYNIIAVDWSVLSIKDKLYLVSAVDAVGKVVGKFIIDVAETNENTISSVHLIGSSVGAHIGGAAGQTVAQKGKKVERITGLAPTHPEDLQVLDKDDAEFVDVIHTSEYFGNRQIGTVDFYVTANGTQKPICFNDTSCGEKLADEYYIMTIDDATRFEGVSCYNVSLYMDRMCDRAHSAVMGEYVSRNATGSYLVARAGASALLGSKYMLMLTGAVALWFVYNL